MGVFYSLYDGGIRLKVEDSVSICATATRDNGFLEFNVARLSGKTDPRLAQLIGDTLLADLSLHVGYVGDGTDERPLPELDIQRMIIVDGAIPCKAEDGGYGEVGWQWRKGISLDADEGEKALAIDELCNLAHDELPKLAEDVSNRTPEQWRKAAKLSAS